MNNIQKKLKNTRKEKGYTQQGIANLLGISQQAYQQVESGRTEDMRVSTLIKLCEILEISSDWLLGIKKPKLITEFDPSFVAIMTGDIDTPVKGMIIPGKKKEENTVIQPLTATADE